MTDVDALIVTYHPDEVVLFDLISRLTAQVRRILLIDNATPLRRDFIQRLPPTTQVIENTDNHGLAYCYNEGIRQANVAGARYVVLFDQDSLPDSRMVLLLQRALERLEANGDRVAAVGPSYVDVKGASGFFVRKGWLHLQRIPSEENKQGAIRVDHLISSGCLIDLKWFEHIGPFTECLFIDYVDTEWCLRARARGYGLYGIPAARMQHDMGTARINVFGRSIMLHTPLRSYYRVRNGVWLLRQPWVGWNWRVIDAVRLCQVAGAFALLPRDRLQHIRAMWRGLTDAMRGRMGRAAAR